ncbi:MAG TPA: hypothetical protein VGQ65_02305 [Thermoanaerobaculia bacterium]|jgi:hypothetical protein|nr:hypothetical protein [Thermoanaerobaculia bacterium]
MYDFRAGFAPGVVPLFWTAMPIATLRAILLREVMVFVFLNPLHLVRKLRAAGFEVETDRRGLPIRAFKDTDRGPIQVSQLVTMINFCIDRLVPEDEIVRMVQDGVDFAVSREIKAGQNINMKLQQQLWRSINGDPKTERGITDPPQDPLTTNEEMD